MPFAALIVAVQRYPTAASTWETKSGDAFALVTVPSNNPWCGGSYFIRVGGIKVVAISAVPVTVQRYGSGNSNGIDLALNPLHFVAPAASQSRQSDSNLVRVCRVEVVADGAAFPVTVKWSQCLKQTKVGSLPLPLYTVRTYWSVA